MIFLLLSFHLNCILVSGSSFSDQVDQTPANIYTTGENVKIYCSHSITNYNRILWYKQSKTQLQLLGFLFSGRSTIEPGVNVTMDGGANVKEKCTLTIKDIELSSSGVYFCAAYYHSVSASSDQVDQTPANIYTNGEEAQIYCSHSITNYNTILWYKQSEETLQLLGYLRVGKGTPETGVNVTIDGGANEKENCTLTITDLKLSSSGVYFCAASYHSGMLLTIELQTGS
ncbi:uncharacterized protein LOC120434968 [Oreochromis aureus]|uniref:uncharacterized protein LOC120434968 n=1 Tax=Oreochromis aureus TaxID=47969 RepID=UPI001953E531|nr:uncharacterized protein LOC120434968 [Oreochromis aureus]